MGRIFKIQAKDLHKFKKKHARRLRKGDVVRIYGETTKDKVREALDHRTKTKDILSSKVFPSKIFTDPSGVITVGIGQGVGDAGAPSIGTPIDGGTPSVSPTLSSLTVEDANSNNWVAVFSVAVTTTSAGWSLNIGGTPSTITNVAGSGTTTVTFTTTETVVFGDVLTLDYSSGDCVSVADSKPLADIVAGAITNNVSLTLPVASSVVVTESGRVFSLGYTYSHDDVIDEAFQETQWQSINISGITEVGNTLTAVVDPPQATPYYIGEDEPCGKFNTISLGDWVDTGAKPIISGDFSFSTLFNYDSGSSGTSILLEARDGTNSGIVFYAANGVINLFSSETGVMSLSGQDYRDDTWYRYTAQRVGTTLTLKTEEINGTLIESTSVETSATWTCTAQNALVSRQYAISQQWDGLICDLKLEGSTDDFHYPFDDGSGLNVRDISGNNNDGTINLVGGNQVWDSTQNIYHYAKAAALPTNYTYQWFRADDNQGLNDTLLVGDTSATLLLADPDHVNYLLRMVATDVNGDSYSSYYTPTVGYAASMDYALVREGEASEVLLVFDRDMGLTDDTGWTINENDVDNPITGSAVFENTITFTVTNAIAQGDVITINYNGGTGNTEAFANALPLSDITERIADNKVGVTFGNEIRFNFMFFSAFGGGANWNDLDFTYHGAQDNTLSNLVDETGTNTGASISVLAAESFGADEGNTGLSTPTAHFTADAWKNAWQLYDDNGDNQEVSTWRINGLVSYQMYRIWMSYIQKGFGTAGYHVYRTQGHALFSPAILPALSADGETSYYAMTDANGDLTITQKAHSSGQGAISTTQLQAKSIGFVIEPVEDGDPRTQGFNVLLMPQGAEDFNTRGLWKNWGAGNDAYPPTANEPTWNTTTRTFDFVKANTEYLLSDGHTTTSGSFEFWLDITTPSSWGGTSQRPIAFNNTQYLRFDTSSGMFFGTNSITTSNLALSTRYRIRVVVNGASGTCEIRDIANTIIQAETTKTTTTVGYSNTNIKIGIDNVILNGWDGSIAFLGVRKTLFTTTEKNNMFTWLHNNVQ